MWYVYLNREQHYLRSYRTHNLWLDHYNKKIRTPKVTAFHLGLFKRLAKTYSGVSSSVLSRFKLEKKTSPPGAPTFLFEKGVPHFETVFN